jgi:uncharacterized protein YqiB (DUF1249 family)
MLCEADIRVSWRMRPRGFIALMSLYESNYLRFVQLAGEPARLSGIRISRPAQDCELQLAVLEHMRYTSTLSLTYVLAPRPGAPAVRVPDLRLRVYHDARLLEAEAGCAADTVRRAAVPPRERELHQRWMRNMMLNKWLEYCADRGHRFTGPAT